MAGAEFVVVLAALAIPAYTYYLIGVKGPADTQFEREQALTKFNRHWHFHVINENVAIRFKTEET